MSNFLRARGFPILIQHVHGAASRVSPTATALALREVVLATIEAIVGQLIEISFIACHLQEQIPSCSWSKM
jgi:hypothetical protein